MTMYKIGGTWFEFFHHSKVEGAYWNAACRSFTEAQWRQKIQEISGLGMKYLVLLCSSLAYDDHAESYFAGGPYPFPENMICKNPIEILLDEADRQELRVFMSCGFYGNWTHTYENMKSLEVRNRAFTAMDELYSQFGRHRSFFGWYLPDETGLDENGFPAFFIDYVNTYHAKIRELNPSLPLLIAPYGVSRVQASESFVAQLEQLDCDFVAYQDGVGVRHSALEKVSEYFSALNAAHKKASRSRIWADVELFAFEGEVYHSPLIPAPIQRVEQQLSAVAPYVEEILVYQYQGMMNPPNSPAFLEHPDSCALYQEYSKSIR